MRITRRKLRQVIKEEMRRLDERHGVIDSTYAADAVEDFARDLYYEDEPEREFLLDAADLIRQQHRGDMDVNDLDMIATHFIFRHGPLSKMERVAALRSAVEDILM